MTRYEVTGLAARKHILGKPQRPERVKHVIKAWTEKEAVERWKRAHPRHEPKSIAVSKLMDG